MDQTTMVTLDKFVDHHKTHYRNSEALNAAIQLLRSEMAIRDARIADLERLVFHGAPPKEA